MGLFKNRFWKRRNRTSDWRHNRARFGLESLENRLMMAADFSFSNGLLEIDGTVQDDYVEVSYLTTNVRTRFGQWSMPTLSIEHGYKNVSGGLVSEGTKYYSPFLVDKIEFDAGDGDDEFRNNSWTESAVWGGDGNDLLVGGSGQDWLSGEAGVDVIYGGNGNDDLFGGFGDDYVYGQAGDDYLNGGWGSDRLDGGDGHDTLRGSEGNDFILGGTGVDRLVEYVKGDAALTNSTLALSYDAVTLTKWLNSVEHATLIGTGSDNDIDASGFFVGSVKLIGGAGNDVLRGTWHNDVLLGGSGDDALNGGGGNDLLRGQTGDDVLRGGAGADQIFGDSGNDRLEENVSGQVTLTNSSLTVGPNGFFGPPPTVDVLYSVEEADLTGSGLSDTMIAGEFTGDVTLRGKGGNDVLVGGFGDDTLYGGWGNDSLFGMTGNDGLFGGDGQDVLTGGIGGDRFLWQNGDTIKDKSSDDAKIKFVDSDGESKSYDGNTYTYTAAAWTESEIEITDGALAVLHERVGNTSLLKTKYGGEVTFERIGDCGCQYAGWNGGAKSQFANTTFDKGDAWVHQAVFHEIGHNWDNENSKWSQFKQLSGWTKQDKSGDANYEQSGNGDWYLKKNADFARTYGKTNPKEDFATSFAAYFMQYAGEEYSTDLGTVDIPAKLQLIDEFLDDLMS